MTAAHRPLQARREIAQMQETAAAERHKLELDRARLSGELERSTTVAIEQADELDSLGRAVQVSPRTHTQDTSLGVLYELVS